ncbi:MAG: FHA domain-containing protein [Zoogloeaceae bacterium]|jgi:predicted component of type VI protein secretion system|nr:FHA domain-containing protein [Zoogloeaceae bacterium]
MAKLILSMDGLVLKEFYLNKPRITIGRRAANDIQINNLAISGEHAAIVTILKDSFLEDLNSTNGTQVNGHNIKKCVLHDNDEIGMGKYKIKYLATASPEETSAEERRIEMAVSTSNYSGVTTNIGTATQFENNYGMSSNVGTESSCVETVAFSPQEMLQSQRDLGTSSTPQQVSAPFSIPQDLPPITLRAVLKIMNGSNKNKELPLTKEHTLLGKMGGQIAAIRREGYNFYLSHVEGASRPLVNQRPLLETAYRLEEGDEIEVVGVKMRFTFKL